VHWRSESPALIWWKWLHRKSEKSALFKRCIHTLPNKDNLGIGDKKFQIGDVDGAVNEIEGAVGFILYIENGFITLLEGYTNIIDKWPEFINEITLTYDSGEKRDIVSLREKWTC
jgi:hypothetical protein